MKKEEETFKDPFDDKDVVKFILPALIWSVPIVVLSSIINFYGFLIGLKNSLSMTETGMRISFLQILTGVLVASLVDVIIIAIFFYFGLKSLSKKIDISSYNQRLKFSTFLFLSIIILSTLVSSLLQGKFTPSGGSLLSLVLMFILPLIIKAKK